MSNEYWIDDDGYIAYGVGDSYITVAEIIAPQHIEPLTKIIEMCQNKDTPAEDRYGRELDKVKPLAQYLAEHIKCQHSTNIIFWNPEDLVKDMQQTLDAYESTEQVKIRIEPV